VDDRKNEFEVNSPRWDFYGSDGPRSIASEDSGHGWTWTTHKDTCPKRLLNRVRKESTATLVITNVTTDDNGVYGCSLVLKISSAVTSKVKLIVTSKYNGHENSASKSKSKTNTITGKTM
jgi:hypothetical protein